MITDQILTRGQGVWFTGHMDTHPRPTGEYQQIRAEIENAAPDLPDTRKAYAGYLEADNGTQFGNTRQRRQAGRARGRFLRELKRAARTARQEARSR